jgi:hypothetical protein
MSEEHRHVGSDVAEVTGQAARRRFLKTTGGVAVAAPAAVLLLSASRANAQPNPYADFADNGPA